MLIAQRPTLSEESLSEFRSRFVIEPLEPGFGYTLGNSLRRTLLSSIPGAAVTSIRIDNIQHEFATIPGVKEDVVEIVLNIKNLVVSSEHDEPITAYLRKQGAGQVTAADISAPAGVEIHNPDLVIATLNDKAKFELELTIERGRGYVSASQNRSEFSEAGQIPIDSIYSPVLKVTYRVEATRAGERTDFDRLVVDVESKPAITPRDAIASAGRTLVELFGLARELNSAAEGIEIGPAPVDAVLSSELSMPIEDLDLSRAQLQLPQARGHQHRQRARRPLGDAAHEHPQLRTEVGRRGQGQARRDGPVAQGQRSRVRRRALLRRLRRRRDQAARDQLESCPSPPRVPASAAVRHTSACCSRTSPRRCSRTRASRPRRRRPSACVPWPSGSSPSRSAATCTRVVACSASSRTRASCTSSSPRSRRWSPTVRAATPAS